MSLYLLNLICIWYEFPLPLALHFSETWPKYWISCLRKLWNDTKSNSVMEYPIRCRFTVLKYLSHRLLIRHYVVALVAMQLEASYSLWASRPILFEVSQALKDGKCILIDTTSSWWGICTKIPSMVQSSRVIHLHKSETYGFKLDNKAGQAIFFKRMLIPTTSPG